MDRIQIRNIYKSFGERKVLENFSMEIPIGKTTAVMGKSGGGKTTLLRIIAGLDKADSGEILNLPENISFVFQEDRLCPDFNAVSNVRFVTGDKVPQEEIEETLRALKIRDIKKTVSEMSGGMARRVSIARALCAPYDMLILDEPFKGLDEELKESVMTFIKGKIQGKTVILVTHDMKEAEMMSDRVVNLDGSNDMKKGL